MRTLTYMGAYGRRGRAVNIGEAWNLLGEAKASSLESSSESRSGMPGKKTLRCAVVAFALAMPVLATGCRVAEGDVKRWETTQRGPYKLVAVVTHDKYSWELRTAAALSLVNMPPRGGVRQGIKFLIDKYKDEEGEERDGALVQLNEDSRRQIVDRMAPALIEELGKPAPSRQPDGRIEFDKTIPYKDATFAMLVHEPPLVSNEKTKHDLRAALVKWAQTSFEDRVENGAQQYGMEQMMRYLGAESVKTLPSIVSENTSRIDRIATLVKDIGDQPAQLELAKAYVALAEKYNSKEWLDAQTKVVKEHNAKNNVKADDTQVAAQVDKIQERRLTEEVFPAMKRIGHAPSKEYLLKYAADGSKPAERRKLALAALEGMLDKGSVHDLDRVFAMAKDESMPDVARSIAFQRIGEFPKEQIIPRLYGLFNSPKWKVRWVAAETILKTMTPKQVPEFMTHLPKTPAIKMGMTEPLSYGGVIAKMEAPAGEPKPRDIIIQYLSSKDFGPMMTALGSFWEGKKADIPVVKGHENDKTELPKCEKEEECSWQCDVPKAATGPASKEMEPKELKTVGEFVKFCLIPSMEK